MQNERDTPAIPWDRKLTEGLARDTWLAANRPSELPREPPLRERVRSPWFWIVLLSVAGLTAARALTTLHGFASSSLWVGSLAVLYGGLYIERRIRSRQ
jgi:hypothetical protein